MRSPASKPLEKGPKSLRKAVNDVRQDALTAQPVAGDGIKVSEHEGKGTIISVDRGTVGGPGVGVGAGFSVQGDSGFVDNVNHIQFTISSDPSAGFINVVDGGGGVAVVQIPVIPVSPGGFVVLVDDDGSTQWQATSTC